MRGAVAPELPVVLIAEDDPLIAELLTIIVELAGYVPLVAHTGQAALDLAQAQCPALLIAELLLPELDGTALIPAVRAACGSAIPTILLTSLVNIRAKATGATMVLPKPFHVATLETQITQLLGS